MVVTVTALCLNLLFFVPQEAVWKHINGTHDDLFVTKQDVILTKSDLNNLTAEAQESVNEVHRFADLNTISCCCCCCYCYYCLHILVYSLFI